jgi:hypothetical protein
VFDDMCDVCAGTGKLLDNAFCSICSGTGSGAEEKVGLRLEVDRLRSELATNVEELGFRLLERDRYRKAIETALSWGHDTFRKDLANALLEKA